LFLVPDSLFLELVWKAWTEPEHFMRWWGPKGYTTPACTIDLRAGGRFLNCMRSPEDRDGANQGWSESFDKLAEYLAAGR
jgi:uncharacterized protein YndB with AHSA1/START domain